MMQSNIRKVKHKQQSGIWLIRPQYLIAALVLFAGLSTWLLSSTHADTGITAPAQNFNNLQYASTSGTQKLDLHLPARQGTPVPLVIDIHGGAFMEGDKADESYNYSRLLAAGYAVASVNYRLSGEAQFPAGGQDVKAAVRWLRANAATYGIDTYRFAAWGRSAGAYMANMLGTTGDQATVFDNDALGNATVSDAVQAVVSLYSPTNFATMDDQAREYCGNNYQVHDASDSPESIWLKQAVPESSLTAKANLVSYVGGNANLPAFFLSHGKADCTVAYGQSVELYDALKAKGQNPQLELRDGIGHADEGFDDEITDVALPFVQSAFAAIQTPTPVPADPVIDSFSANPTTIEQGETTTVQWQSTGATSCSIEPSAGQVAVDGSWKSPSLTNATSQTYTLACLNSAGKQATATVTVVVKAAAIPAPTITDFSANPATIESGTTARLTWTSDNVEASGCSIAPSPLTSALAEGSWVTPVLTGSMTYTLTCRNSAGTTATRSLTIVVTQPTAPQPQPTENTPTDTPPQPSPSPSTPPVSTPPEPVVVSQPTTQPVASSPTPPPTATSPTSAPTTTSTIPSSQPVTTPTAPATTTQSTSKTTTSSSPATTIASQTARSTITTNTPTPITNSLTVSTVSGETTLDATNVTDSAKEKTITKTEYYVKGTLIYTDSSTPYTLDTTKLRDGEHTITERTHYTDGSSSDVIDTVVVANNTARSGGRSSASTVALGITLTSAALIGSFIVMQFIKRRSSSSQFTSGSVVAPQNATLSSTDYPEDTSWQQNMRGPRGGS